VTRTTVAEAATTRLRPRSGRRSQLPAAEAPQQAGPASALPADEVFSLVLQLPMVAELPAERRNSQTWGVPVVLAWLQQHPGESWQERWLAAGADQEDGWLDDLAGDDPRKPSTKRSAMVYAVDYLMLTRVILPAHSYLASHKPHALLRWARQHLCPDSFARLEQAGAEMGMRPHQVHDGLTVISRIVLHTGRDIDQLTGEDIYQHRNFYHALGRRRCGNAAAWELLAHIGVLPAGSRLDAGTRLGQRPAEAIADYHQVQSQRIRGVLIRYLSERLPAMDYSSWRMLAGELAGLFWADIERHHPGIETLRLPPDVADGWKQRLRTWTAADGTTRERKHYLAVLAQVRAFYLDIQEWALEDPSWAEWAAPSPVRRSELAGMAKARRKTVSEMHQRVRERLPHLQRLAGSASGHLAAQAALLAAAAPVPVGQEFTHEGVTWRRAIPKAQLQDPIRRRDDHVVVEDAAGGMVNVTEDEDYAFWTWAVIETLRHTGVRHEELLEITQLAITSYRLPRTGEAIPLLQIVPSKSNEERLLLVSPELASVLASIIKRLRDNNNGRVPLVARYDPHEKVTGPPLPHLFQRKNAWRPSVIGPSVIGRMLNDALARAGITDAAGQSLRYTAHDFRRMFATEAVTGGLPVHIAAKILGHRNIATVESYIAVFQDDLVRTYRAFLDKRRAVRPEAEYREPTDEEWHEFEEHFEKRRLEIGTCGRPYGTPCAHEHACIRCAMLRPDPAARGRLTEIIKNLADRISEARINGWLGEVEGLQISLHAARAKLAAIDRAARNNTGPTDLGMPAIPPARQERHP
jgi:integrase